MNNLDVLRDAGWSLTDFGKVAFGSLAAKALPPVNNPQMPVSMPGNIYNIARRLYNGQAGALSDSLSDLSGGAIPQSIERVPRGSGSGSFGYYPSPSAQQLDYFGADLAKRYGMDRATAYNEAMANTAYQRAVADMQAAGLNPASLFSAGRASVAGSGYVSGGSSGGYSSARGAAKDDQLPGWLYYGVTALVQAVGTAATKSPYAGFAMSQVAQNVMKAFNGIK